MQGALASVFIENALSGRSGEDILAAVFLTLLALLFFRFLGAVADALISAISGLVRIVSGALLPLLFLLLVLFVLFGG